MSDRKKPVARSLPDNEYDRAHQQAALSASPTEPVNPYSSRDAIPYESHIAVLDLKAAAAVPHCHPKTLRLMAIAKKISAQRVGSRWRFSEKRLIEWLEASQVLGLEKASQSACC